MKVKELIEELSRYNPSAEVECTYSNDTFNINGIVESDKHTNADRIRNMSGEELAKYIYDVSEHCADCVVCGDDCDSCDGTEDICVPKIVEWLKSEAE